MGEHIPALCGGSSEISESLNAAADLDIFSVLADLD